MLILLVIISSYLASPRRITVLVNFQAIPLISLAETSSNPDIFFTDDAAQKISFFLTMYSHLNSSAISLFL